MPILPVLLHQYRRRAGLTQKQLAERIHFSHTVISRAERPDGSYIPSGVYLSTFATQLGLTEAEAEELHAAARNLLGLPARTNFPEVPVLAVASAPPRRRVPLLWIIGAFSILVVILVLAFRSNTSASARLYQRTAPGGELYFETFERGDLSAWKSLNNGRWEIFDVAGNRVLGVRDQDPDAVPNAYLLSSEDWTDYSFSSEVIFEPEVFEQIYLVVRSRREENCTGYRVGGNRLGVSIFRFDPVNGCDGEVLAEDLHISLEPGRLYLMRVEAAGSRIRFYIDGKLILEAQDVQYPAGGVGLLAYQVNSAYFDNIRVEKAGQGK